MNRDVNEIIYSKRCNIYYNFHHQEQMKSIDKEIWNIAWPSIVSNITVPLLGLIDVTIVGHLGAATYIGAIAVGSMMFNLIYWVFGFLRMGTSGMTSQAYGANNRVETQLLLFRSLGVGIGISLLLLLLQTPIRQATFSLIHATPEVVSQATTYFHICIWGAPAMLGLYSLTGWFIGMQNSKLPMWIAISQNIVNIATSLCLVYLFKMKVEGVALGTLIAQYAGFIMAIFLYIKYYYKPSDICLLRGKTIWERGALIRFFQVNRDIFLRTLCLVSVTLFFTATGASKGEVILAVNTLLMQLFTLYSYIMDGFAYAGEALAGRYLGEGNRMRLQQSIRHLFAWGGMATLLFTLLYLIGGESFLNLLTNEQSVISASTDYFPWAVAIPIAGMAAFVWDGIYIGCTYTRGMLFSMLCATTIYFLLYFLFSNNLGNHALWLAFISYLLTRGIVQTLLSRRL